MQRRGYAITPNRIKEVLQIDAKEEFVYAMSMQRGNVTTWLIVEKIRWKWHLLAELDKRFASLKALLRRNKYMFAVALKRILVIVDHGGS